MALLEVRDLQVSFDTPDGVVRAVRGLSFDVERGTTLAIVGESGSGKSVATQTITGLTRGARISGSAVFDGTELLGADIQTLRKVRGAQIGMIFQDPLSSLHPYYTVGWQIVEMIRAHDHSTSKAAARKRAAHLLTLVGIPHAESRIDDYPHQFSGGMRQRVMIAMAMALNPALLIADEPTTALDVTVQAQVLLVIRRLQEEFGTAVILIRSERDAHGAQPGAAYRRRADDRARRDRSGPGAAGHQAPAGGVRDGRYPDQIGTRCPRRSTRRCLSPTSRRPRST